MTDREPIWVIERDDGRWRIRGGPDHANAGDLGFALETAAEEIKRLGVDGDELIEIRADDGPWAARARHIVRDHGIEEAPGAK